MKLSQSIYITLTPVNGKEREGGYNYICKGTVALVVFIAFPLSSSEVCNVFHKIHSNIESPFPARESRCGSPPLRVGQGLRGPRAVAGTVQIRVTWKDGFKNTRCHSPKVVEQCIGITERKEELFVHSFKPLRTVFRHLVWVFVCVKHKMQDQRESMFKWHATQGSRLMELSILLSLHSVLFINTPAM